MHRGQYVSMRLQGLGNSGVSCQPTVGNDMFCTFLLDGNDEANAGSAPHQLARAAV